MNFTELEPYLSTPRLQRYYKVCKDNDRAIALYQGNLSLASALHPLLSTTEVVVRNALYGAIANHLGDNDWIINELRGFMDDKSLKPGRHYLKRQVEHTVRSINKRGIKATSSRILSEQSFRFWIELLASHHFKLLKASPIKAFSVAPTPNRNEAYSKLDALGLLRNRMNHCEPLFLKKDRIDFDYVLTRHKYIGDVLAWINPDLLTWLEKFNNVPKVISECSKI